MRPSSTASAASRSTVPASSPLTTVVSWMTVPAMAAPLCGGRRAVSISGHSTRTPTGGSSMLRSRSLRRLAVLTAVLAAALASAWPGAVDAQTATARKGGVLRVGMIGEPPTLDQHATTAVITREIAANAFEGLYALDARFQPAPLIAEGHDIADGGKRYTIRLRKDVKFHNGKLLTSADVVASLRRWGATATTGKTLWKNVEGIEAKGPV